MENPNLTKGHLFADEVHVDGADIVAEDNGGGGQLDVELLE
jgi:hypothetical protein